LEDKDVDERMILKWMLRKWNGGLWNELWWLKRGTAGGIF